ncbi:MAG: dipeptidase [Segetibacter sp.]|nr:dipeptidase [Segetibacter sp.]
MVDVSHVGEKTFEDVIAISTKPIIASHSCAYSLAPHRRNVKDEQLKAIAKNGGVVFVNFYSGFLDSTYENKTLLFLAQHKPELDSLVKISTDNDMAKITLFSMFPAETSSFRPPLSYLVKNIDYIAKLIGVDHVGIGADFDGAESFPMQMNDVSCYPLIVIELKKLGYSKGEIIKIAARNFMRVLRANEKNL